MIRLKCLSCGLVVPYRGSEGDFCPRCLARDQQAVRLIAISDKPSSAPHRTAGRIRLRTKVQDDVHTIALSGELDTASAPILGDALAEACAGGAREVVVDLGGIEFMDSTGLSAILRGQAHCEEHHCSFSLTPAQRPVERVFELTGVKRRLRFRRAG